MVLFCSKVPQHFWRIQKTIQTPHHGLHFCWPLLLLVHSLFIFCILDIWVVFDFPRKSKVVSPWNLHTHSTCNSGPSILHPGLVLIFQCQPNGISPERPGPGPITLCKVGPPTSLSLCLFISLREAHATICYCFVSLLYVLPMDYNLNEPETMSVPYLPRA